MKHAAPESNGWPEGRGLEFKLVDVFGTLPYSGNPLPVVFGGGELDASRLLRVTQEFGQFETIFVSRAHGQGAWHARVFDLIEELPFAGHPLLGAGVAIVDAEKRACPARVELLLGERNVAVDVDRRDGAHMAWLDAGRPTIDTLIHSRVSALVRRFGLAGDDLLPAFHPAVVDTGLRYLVLPVTSQALTKARIEQDIGELVRRESAQFAVLIDVAGREMRHWNNDGKLEDIATGSAAAAVGSYLVASGAAQADETIPLAQGRFLGRPSTLTVRTQSLNGAVIRAHVGGNVHLIGEGRLKVLP